MPNKNLLLFIAISLILTSVAIHNTYPHYIKLLSDTLKINAVLNADIHANNSVNNNTKKSPLTQYSETTEPAATYLELPVKKQRATEACLPPPLSNITTQTIMLTHPDGTTEHKKIKQYYVLHSNLSTKNNEFFNEFSQKLTTAFQYIEKSLGVDLLQQIKLNFVFQSTREDYEKYVLQQGRSPQNNQGMYLHHAHLSIVEIKNYQQGIATSLHEAIHAFNNSYWGYSLRFFNEGMAEYFENITLAGTVPAFDFSSLVEQQYPEQISTLLFSETDWHGNNTQYLYQNSKALFHFLMSDPLGRKLILEIMTLEQKHPCSALSNRTIETMLFDIFPNHQQAFDYWFSDGREKLLQHGKQHSNNGDITVH
jgi:hypothetical protein